MLNSKQRSYLRALGSKEPAVVFIGKNDVDDAVIKNARDAIVARELIKGKVQKNALTDAKEAANALAVALKADIVAVTGSTFLLFKRNPQHVKIKIPTRANPHPERD